MSNTTDRTASWAAEATAMGMSYGQYVAKYHPPGISSPSHPMSLPYTKTCPECGQVFQTSCSDRIYCCEKCYRRFNNRKYYHSAKEKSEC